MVVDALRMVVVAAVVLLPVKGGQPPPVPLDAAGVRRAVEVTRTAGTGRSEIVVVVVARDSKAHWVTTTARHTGSYDAGRRLVYEELVNTIDPPGAAANTPGIDFGQPIRILTTPEGTFEQLPVSRPLIGDRWVRLTPADFARLFTPRPAGLGFVGVLGTARPTDRPATARTAYVLVSAADMLTAMPPRNARPLLDAGVDLEEVPGDVEVLVTVDAAGRVTGFRADMRQAFADAYDTVGQREQFEPAVRTFTYEARLFDIGEPVRIDVPSGPDVMELAEFEALRARHPRG